MPNDHFDYSSALTYNGPGGTNSHRIGARHPARHPPSSILHLQPAMPSIFPTACECTAPGWCPRHKCHKDRAYFEYCRRLECWFQLWEQGATLPPLGRGGQGGSDQVSTEPREPCRHFGLEVRRQDCPTCRGHVELKILACAVHQECALSPSAVAVQSCVTCGDYQPPS